MTSTVIILHSLQHVSLWCVRKLCSVICNMVLPNLFKKSDVRKILVERWLEDASHTYLQWDKSPTFSYYCNLSLLHTTAFYLSDHLWCIQRKTSPKTWTGTDKGLRRHSRLWWRSLRRHRIWSIRNKLLNKARIAFTGAGHTDNQFTLHLFGLWK